MQADYGFSDDFRSARFGTETFTFSATQAAVVQVLWRNWNNGTPAVGGDYLAVECEFECRVVDLFKRSGAWKKLIVPVPASRGAVRLGLPDKKRF